MSFSNILMFRKDNDVLLSHGWKWERTQKNILSHFTTFISQCNENGFENNVLMHLKNDRLFVK
jgi:hypothetical protein